MALSRVPIIFRDIVCISPAPTLIVKGESSKLFREKIQMHYPTGEFGNFASFSAAVASEEDAPHRLFETIQNLIDLVYFRHSDSVADLAGEDTTFITRMITNEFMFYTKKPLTLEHFQGLLQNVSDAVKDKSENFHLILSSFAVKTPSATEENAKIMNVVVLVECGRYPTFTCIVKNHPSSLDPAYKEDTSEGPIPLLNVTRDDDISNFHVTIDGVHCPFTFNNVFIRGDKHLYWLAVDICLDQDKKVAIKNFTKHLGEIETTRDIPTLCSYVVTSNTTAVIKDKCLANYTQADPKESRKLCKEGASIAETIHLNEVLFGTPTTIIVTNPLSCSELRDEGPLHFLTMVRQKNAGLYISDSDEGPSDSSEHYSPH